MRFGAALLTAVLAFAQATVTVAKVQEFVRSSIKLKLPDKQIADQLHHFKLSEKLTPQDIEELQGEGAGPKTIAALKELGTTSAALPAAAPPPPPVIYKQPPPPPYEKQQDIIKEAREYALNYTQSLPDFICARIDQRYYDPNNQDNWRFLDKIVMRITYNGQKENYQIMTINGQMPKNVPINASNESLGNAIGGTTSTGEFASMLKYIFEPKSDAEFHWERWATLRKHICYVFNYVVDQPHSQWGIYDGESKQSVVPGYRGLIFIDRETGQILKITLESINIPPDFPIQMAKSTLDYDWADISGHQFLLPYNSEVMLNRGKLATKNQYHFTAYRKFSADAVISFDEVKDDADTKPKEAPQGPPPPK